MISDEEISPTQSESCAELTDTELGIVEFFVKLASALGLPKSVGEIFGFLYSSKEPRSFDEIVSSLKISKGSASQGLKFLGGAGAVAITYKPGDRKNFYVAETSIRKLFTNSLQESVRPRLDANDAMISELIELAAKESAKSPTNSDHLNSRVSSLQNWNKKAIQLLPLLEGFFTLSSPTKLMGLLEREKKRDESGRSPQFLSKRT